MMCMAHATPHRAYLIKVLGDSPPPLDTHHGDGLLNQLRHEVASGAYTNAEVWHPVATELLTFAATNMRDIQSICSKPQRYNYPVCDVIEGIGDFINCLGSGGFTPAGQSTHFQLLGQLTAPTWDWQHGELAKFILWVNAYPGKLPLTQALLENFGFIRKLQAIARNRGAVNLMQVQVNQRDIILRTRINAWTYQRTARIEGLDLRHIHRLLLRGHTLTECRGILRQASHWRIPPVTWTEAYRNWDNELPSLPVGDWHRTQLKQLTDRYQKPAKRGKAISQYIANMMKQPATGLPLIRHIWPEVSVSVDVTGQTCYQIQDWQSQSASLLARLNRFVEYGNDEKARLLLTEAESFLIITEEQQALPRAA